MPTLYINTDATDISRSAVKALNILSPVGIPQIVLGDNRDWTLYFVTGSGAYTSWSGSASYSLRIGVGPSGANPTGGTYTIGGDGAVISGTTAPIPYDAAADAVNAAITHPTSGLTVVSTGLPVTAAEITVSGDAGNLILDFGGAVADTAIGAFVCSDEELTPTSGAIVTVVRAGGNGLNARQAIRLRQLPYCFQDTFTRITNGWIGKLSANTETLAEWLGNNGDSELPFEIEVTDGSGYKTTYFQGTVPVLNEVIDGQALVPTPLPSSDYYTKTETDALLAYKAALASPALTGTPTAPTATLGTNTTQIATTAFVQSAVGDIEIPVTSVNGKTGAVVLVKADIGLGNVDNTSDANKPISTATQTALDLKADTSSLATVATTGDYNDLINLPTLGTAAAKDVGQAAGNVLELSANNTVSLGNPATEEEGVLRLFDNSTLEYSELRSIEGALAFSSTVSGEIRIAGAPLGFLLNGGALTAYRTYTLPNASGTLALTSDLTGLQSKAVEKSANFTAEKDGVYTITASCTVTDPTPTQAASYTVIVRNGTATIGGTGYATAGTVIRRIYHSGAWASYPYFTTASVPALASDLSSLNASNLTSGTVALARLVNTQTVGNADATISAGTRDVLLTAAITAPRTYTLPAASGYPAGARITFVDVANTITTTNAVTLARAGSDTINGATSIALNTAGASPMLISDGTSRWNLDIRGVSRGGTGSTSLTANNVLLGNGTNPLQTVAPGTSGNVLTSNGTTWTSAAPAGGGVPTSRTISTTAPLTGGGDLSADRTLALTVATAAQTVAGSSTTLPVPPASLLLALLNSGLREFTFSIGSNVTTGSGSFGQEYATCYRIAYTANSTGTFLRRLTSGTYFMSHIGATQAGTNFGKPWGFSARLGYGVSSPNSSNTVYVCIGKTTTTAYGLTGATSFFFIESIGGVTKAGYWNGSAATRTATLSTISVNGVTEVILIGDGAGSLSVYCDGSLATTLTGVPTSYIADQSPFTFEHGAGGSNTDAWALLAYPIKFWSYN